MENYSEERPWGRWTEYHHADGHRIKEMRVKPGHRMSYQYHNFRSEHWFVVQGTATIVFEGETIEIPQFQAFDVPVGKKHRIGNAHEQELVIVEIQYGNKLDETDIVRIEDDYNRVEGEVSKHSGQVDVLEINIRE